MCRGLGRRGLCAAPCACRSSLPRPSSTGEPPRRTAGKNRADLGPCPWPVAPAHPAPTGRTCRARSSPRRSDAPRLRTRPRPVPAPSRAPSSSLPHRSPVRSPGTRCKEPSTRYILAASAPLDSPPGPRRTRVGPAPDEAAGSRERPKRQAEGRKGRKGGRRGRRRAARCTTVCGTGPRAVCDAVRDAAGCRRSSLPPLPGSGPCPASGPLSPLPPPAALLPGVRRWLLTRRGPGRDGGDLE